MALPVGANMQVFLSQAGWREVGGARNTVRDTRPQSLTQAAFLRGRDTL